MRGAAASGWVLAFMLAGCSGVGPSGPAAVPIGDSATSPAASAPPVDPPVNGSVEVIATFSGHSGYTSGSTCDASGTCSHGDHFPTPQRPAAGVGLRLAGAGLDLNATTGEQGRANFTGLPPGSYLLAWKSWAGSGNRTVEVGLGRNEVEVLIQEGPR